MIFVPPILIFSLVVYMANGIILLLLFFFMRILNYPIAVLVYAAQYHDWSVWSALKNLYPMCHTLSAIQFVFQGFWLYQIVRLGAKAILSKIEELIVISN
jgi:hypothetical protein